MSDKEALSPLEERQLELIRESRIPSSPLYLHALFDALLALFDEASRAQKNPHAQKFVDKYGSVISKLKNLRVSNNDFKVLKTLGRGAFGEVNLCKCVLNDKYYAIKKLNKTEMLSRQEAFFQEERNLLGMVDTPWITNLEYAYQDDDYLYLVLEYLPGGNMLNLLFKYNSFEEEQARFYIAETILGVQKVHELNYVYRDLKPENMLFDKEGHVKLADFGSCYLLNAAGFVDSQVAAGTPDYIAPEVLQNNEGKKEGCGKESDWWSVGVVLYEMLCADPPFMGESLLQTYSLIMNHKEKFKFPSDVELSEEAKGLIRGLICDRKDRLTFEEIIAHPFFKGLDWNNLRNTKPPFVPELKGPDDTTYFEDEELPDPSPGFYSKGKRQGFSGESFPFIGYSFSRPLSKLSALPEVLINSMGSAADKSSDKKNEVEKLQQRINQEKQRFQGEIKDLNEKIRQKGDELASKERQLSEETNQKKTTQTALSNLEVETHSLEHQIEELKKKLEALQEEKNANLSHIEDLEHEMKAARKLLAGGTRKVAEDSDKRVQDIKHKLDHSVNELQQVQAHNTDLSSKNTLLSVQLQRTKESLEHEEFEKRRILEIGQKVEDEKHKLAADVELSSGTIEKLQAEQNELSKTVGELKNQIENQRRDIDNLMRDKRHLETEKNHLEIQKNEGESKLQLALDREKELNQKIAKRKLSAEDSGDISARDIVRQLQAQVEEAKAAKGNILAKALELTAEFQRVSAEISDLRENSAKEQNEHAEASKRLQTIEAEIEKGAAALASLESDLMVLRGRKGSTAKNLREVTRQKDEEAEKNAKLMQEIEKMKKARAKTTEEIAKLSAELNELHDKNVQNEEMLQELEDMEGNESLSEETEEFLLIKEGITKELASLRSKLDTEARRSIELDELLTKIQKEKAKSDVEKAQFEKELLVEKRQRQDLETKIHEIQDTTSVFQKNADDYSSQLENLKEHLAKVEKKAKKKEVERKELETQTEELRETIDSAQIELEKAKAKQQVPAPTKVENKDRSELGKLRNEYALLQMRLDNEELAKKTLESNMEDLTATNTRLTFELENLKRLQEQRVGQANNDRPKALFIDTKPKDGSEESPSTPTTVFSSLRRGLSTKKRSRIDTSLASVQPSPTEGPHVGLLEGYLKVPKENRLRHGWVKKYILIKDGLITALDKERDKNSLSEGKFLADLRWGIFLCREASEASANAKKEEIPLIFMIQAKPSATPSMNSIGASEAGLTPAQIKTKIAAVEKEIEIEEGILKGIEKMVKISNSQKSAAQQQLDGSRKKLDQLKEHRLRLQVHLEEAGNSRIKKIQLVEDTIRSEEQYQLSLKNLLDLADDETEKENTAKQIEESDKRLADLKDQLEMVKSNSQSTSSIDSELHLREFNGHRFKITTFDVDVYCQYCARLLVNRQGFYCLNCEHVCHKECHTLGGISCSDSLSLRDIPPLYFMASDMEERKKWVDTINQARENFLRTEKDGLAPPPFLH